MTYSGTFIEDLIEKVDQVSASKRSLTSQGCIDPSRAMEDEHLKRCGWCFREDQLAKKAEL